MSKNGLYSEEMATAECAAREAGAIIMSMFMGKFDVLRRRVKIIP